MCTCFCVAAYFRVTCILSTHQILLGRLIGESRLADRAARWLFAHQPSKSMDSLSMVGMDADRHRQTDRCSHRRGHSPYAANGVGPANKTDQNMTEQARTGQEREEQERNKHGRSQKQEKTWQGR